MENTYNANKIYFKNVTHWSSYLLLAKVFRGKSVKAICFIYFLKILLYMYTFKIVHLAVFNEARLNQLKQHKTQTKRVSTNCLRIKYKSFQRNIT